jgi:aerobic C4-dicarboxylate transport protein
MMVNSLSADPRNAVDPLPASGPAPAPRKAPFYRTLWVQVTVAMGFAIVLGYLNPARAVAMKPLGDAFIRAISMIITLIIFCTVVTGIAGMESLKKVGRIGGMALLYFEVVSTIALVIGLLVANVVQPGRGFNVNIATLDARSVADYAGQAKAQSVPDFLIHIIPTTVIDAFAKGDILEVVFVALLFGFALSSVGGRAKPIVDIVESLTSVVFGVTNILMKFAPVGAFGAMAYTVGKFGLASLGPLAKLIGTFWLTSTLFVVIVLGLIAWTASFSIFGFLAYIKVGLLQVSGWTCGPDRFHFQHRWLRSLHDHGRALCGAGDQHTSDADPTTDYPRSSGSHQQGCQRHSGCVVCSFGGYTLCHPEYSCSRHGVDTRH